MNRSLVRASLRYARAHWLQFGLAVAGVALGVAVVTSIDLATGSAGAAFDLSTEAINGRATHQVTGGPTGLDDAIYRQLRAKGWRNTAPVLEEHVFHGPERKYLLTLLGIDPFAEGDFRSFLAPTRDGSATRLDLTTLLTVPNAVLLSRELALELELTAGDTFEIESQGREETLHVAGTFAAGGGSAVKNLLVADMATAQELTGHLGRITRIDLRLESDDSDEVTATLARLRLDLPVGIECLPASHSSEAARQMTQAFRWNLNALSLLALVCGIFLVFNTMSFSIVQRRRHLGILRALGVRRGEIFAQVLIEALALGLAGCAIGLPLGIFLAEQLIGMVTQTINDLYFVVQVSQLTLLPSTLFKALALGVGATVLASLYPAIEATQASPRTVMMRSVVEAKAHRGIRLAVVMGVGLVGLGVALLLIPSRSLLLSLASLFFVLLGCALAVPMAAVGILQLLTPLVGIIWGWVGRLAARGIIASMSRTAVALAALTVAVSVSIGVGVMTESFRATVENWLTYSLPADLYVSPARQLTRSGLNLPSEWKTTIAAVPGVTRINTVQYAQIADAERNFNLVSLDIDESSFSAFALAHGERSEAWRRFSAGEAVLVSEPFSYRYQLGLGDSVELPTPTGRIEMPIAGVYYDYASEQGAVLLDHQVFQRQWHKEGFAGLSIYLAEGVSSAAVVDAIEQRLPQRQVPFLIRSNSELRSESLDIFDRTFLITGILRQLATVVAFLGIFSALMALQLERSRELGVLRAIGLTRRQVTIAVTLQNGLMGIVAGLLAMPLGTVLASLLIFVINKRSFGWSLTMQMPGLLLLEALLIALVAAIAAGFYPARKMSATSPAEALRGE